MHSLTQNDSHSLAPSHTGEDDEQVHFSLTVVDDTPKLCSFEATLVRDPDEVQRQDRHNPPKVLNSSSHIVV